MNLAETLNKMGMNSAAVTKENYNRVIHDDEDEIQAFSGPASDSYHWGYIEPLPPKNTVPVVNVGDKLDKKDRKSKAYKKWEQERQRAQDAGPRRTIVQTHSVDNNDYMDVGRSNWFV